MFSKLAWRNVRRSFRDYGVYLLTLTFGVCLFYTFNSIEGQGAMAYLARNGNPMVEPILMLVDIFSVFVAVVLSCLILYANRFLLRRRKRELGTYLLLGLSQGQVSRLLFLETGLVGLMSLGAGLGLGVLASKGLSALTLSMFERDISPMLSLAFSWKGAGKTVAYFGLLFLLVMAFSGLEVSRARLIDLMQGERRNEEFKAVSLTGAVVQLVLGAVCLAGAYTLLLVFGMAIAVVVLPICIPMLTLGTLGTLLMFRSLSGFVLKLVRGRPGLYFRGLNLFTLRQWISRGRTTYLSQTVVCILLLLAIGITASAVGLNQTLESAANENAPFDITIQNQSADVSGSVDFAALLAEYGVGEKDLAWQKDTIFYYNDPAVTGIEEAQGAVKVSDLDQLRARAGLPAYSGALPALLEGKEIPLTGNLAMACLVVPDEMGERLEVRRQVWSADYAGEKERVEEKLLAAVREGQEGNLLRLDSRLLRYTDLVGNKLLALFLGLYLGFTFLLAAAAVLALQQLSQGADNTRRYAVLRRLGAEERLVRRSATQQVALAFLLPLALALVHAAVGMKAANDLIAQAGQVDSVGSSLAAAALLLAVYGGYFLATALACRRMAGRG